jgi:hypothetical protein
MYYPKSQIKTNLYTNGGEYLLSTSKETYKGNYYEISSGVKYTGISPNTPPNILLIPNIDQSQYTFSTTDDTLPTETKINQITKDQSAIIYNKTLIAQRYIPQFNTPLPTTPDNQNGQFYRYFCKKTNELRYLETDKDTYQKLNVKDPKIAWDLYNPIKILWTLKGNKELVYRSNKGTVLSIEQNLKWYGFSQYFKDNYTKYYLES